LIPPPVSLFLLLLPFFLYPPPVPDISFSLPAVLTFSLSPLVPLSPYLPPPILLSQTLLIVIETDFVIHSDSPKIVRRIHVEVYAELLVFECDGDFRFPLALLRPRSVEYSGKRSEEFSDLL
jgi:hypothetical protein